MKLTKELKFVEGEGFQKLINYKKNIQSRKEDVEGTTKAFEKIKEQILNEDFGRARNGLERVFYEVIPDDFVEKIKNIDKKEVVRLIDTWIVEYLQRGEIGFYMLVYQNIDKR